MALPFKEFARMNNFKPVNAEQNKFLKNASKVFEFHLVDFDKLLNVHREEKFKNNPMKYITKLYSSIGASESGDYLSQGILNMCIDLNKVGDSYVQPVFKIFLQELINTIYSTGSIRVGSYSFILCKEPNSDGIIDPKLFTSNLDIDIPLDNSPVFRNKVIPLKLRDELTILLKKTGFANTVNILDIFRRMRILDGTRYQ